VIIDVTEDRFLGGRVTAMQPKRGFRAGHDTVLLAAAVPAKAGDRVLDLGSGAGIASLCLAARVPGVNIVGVELDLELVVMSNSNAKRNAMHDRVKFVEGDVLRGAIDGAPFDHVFFNPPFHPDTGQVSPSIERDRATRGDVGEWMKRALRLVASEGTVTAIIRADRVDEIDAGDRSLTVLPLLPRIGEAAKRVIVHVTAGATGTRTLPGFVLHESDGRPTPEAEAVLRHAGAIAIG
jgi:tRNA1Val (adenine37-N6)-methyltransferase